MQSECIQVIPDYEPDMCWKHPAWPEISIWIIPHTLISCWKQATKIHLKQCVSFGLGLEVKDRLLF